MGEHSGPDGGDWTANGVEMERLPLGPRIAAIVLVLGLVLTSCGASASDRQRVVDAFEPQRGWVLIPSESGEFHTGFCIIGSIGCDAHTQARWKTVPRMSEDYLRRLAEAAGWSKIEAGHDCEARPAGTSQTCTIRAKSGRVDVTLKSSHSYSHLGRVVTVQAR